MGAGAQRPGFLGACQRIQALGWPLKNAPAKERKGTGLRKWLCKTAKGKILLEGCRAPPINCVLPQAGSGWKAKVVIGDGCRKVQSKCKNAASEMLMQDSTRTKCKASVVRRRAPRRSNHVLCSVTFVVLVKFQHL